MTTCRQTGCTMPIKFVKMRGTGKPMPIDPIPDDRGNIAALKTGRQQYVDGHYLKPGEEPATGEVRLMPHFGTCNGRNVPGRPKRPRPPEPPPTLFDPASLPDPPPPF